MAQYSSETIARLSEHTAKIDLAPMHAALDARTAEHDRQAAAMVEAPDGDLQRVLEMGPAEVKRVSTPFRERWIELEGEVRNGLLTQAGYQQRREALKVAHAEALDAAVFRPMQNLLAAAGQRFTGFLSTPAASAQTQASATAIAGELRLLTPARGLQRISEVVQQAAQSDDFSVLRALLPFVRSLIESKDSGWFGDEGAYELVSRVEEAARPWIRDVGESRLADVAWLQYQTESLRQAALEAGGDLDKSTRYKVSDFAAGKIRRGPDDGPRWKRIRRGGMAAARKGN
jgi:hypothetical protein